ncbi:hypothetical protein K438DRAFT_2019373 [Mycena galopus ATCC 62051]|nr:hypothetical protein K438DRAFT_2019373 [Mycena galopus ATCC 62051]
MRVLYIAGCSWATWYHQHNYQHVLGKDFYDGARRELSRAHPILYHLLCSPHSPDTKQHHHHPIVLFYILDDYLSRNDEQPRLIGTHSPDNTQIHVCSSFAVLHNENEEHPPHLPSAATSPTLAAALLLPLLPCHRQTHCVQPHRSALGQRTTRSCSTIYSGRPRWDSAWACRRCDQCCQLVTPSPTCSHSM